MATSAPPERSCQRHPGRPGDHGLARGRAEPRGRPLVDRVKGSTLHNLKELRPGSAGATEIRILFIFDPTRNVVLLVAGDKAGQWATWYRQSIPLAEERYASYLKEKEGT